MVYTYRGGNGKSSDIELELEHGMVEIGICYSTYCKSRGDLYDKRQDGVFRRIGWEIKDPEPWPNGDLSRRILSTF